MISPNDVYFEHDKFLDCVIVRTKKVILTKIADSLLRSADEWSRQVIFNGIIAMIKGEIPIGKPIILRSISNVSSQLITGGFPLEKFE